MSRELADRVLERLAAQDQLQAQLADMPQLRERLAELQAWQTRRLQQTYADLRAMADFQPAIEFFLSDLYGGGDHSARDRELRRAWSLMQASLPESAMRVLSDALDLDVLTLSLDMAVARSLCDGEISAVSYADAYRVAGRGADRERQIDIVVELARRLARVVGNPWIGRLLRIARGPAEAAGFAVLQSFLERGFDSFARLQDPQRLILAIDERERELMRRLFAAECDPFALRPTSCERTREAQREQS